MRPEARKILRAYGSDFLWYNVSVKSANTFFTKRRMKIFRYALGVMRYAI